MEKIENRIIETYYDIGKLGETARFLDISRDYVKSVLKKHKII
jgi:hypothetical protein